MILQEAHRMVIESIAPFYDNREASNIADIVTEHITGFGKVERILYKKNVIDIPQEEQFRDIVIRLMKHEPIQYITGKAWFYQYIFNVNQHVLIPRPETEELVQNIIQDNQLNCPSIIDIGTGSGCIPISLKKNMEAEITAIDISYEALSVATKNAKELSASIHFKQLNFLDESNWDELSCYDIIVSNPPYIRKKEKESMYNNVLNHEPHLALFVEDNNPLIFYEKIARFGNTHLKNQGTIWVEINEALPNETKYVFEKEHYTTLIYNDLQGKSRILKAWK